MCECMYSYACVPCMCVHVRGKVRAVLHAGQVVYSSGSLAGLTHVSERWRLMLVTGSDATSIQA